MTLKELRDKIDTIIEKTPSWANCERIGIVTDKDEDGFCTMDWLIDIQTICCDGQGMVAFELVMEE
jgi:hypothetical protein